MSSEYVTDVSYVRRIDNDLAPVRLRLVAALNGFSPPPKDDYGYCELGCGFGDTTIALAAANPRARFFGVDIIADHITEGKRVAKEGELTNIELLQRDFEGLDAEVPDFDYVTAHGVLSWISPAKRAAMIAFAKRKLKPGGLLYLSYNAMPGWAAIEPLRQILLSATMGVECDSTERARRGLAFAKELEAAGSDYFRSNPTAKEMLKLMEKEGLTYVAHEYLNSSWVPMYFAQVAFELAQNDLHYVGSLPLHTNYRDVALPSAVAKLFEKMTDRLTFESMKDLALNEFFRRDVFVKGRPTRDGASAYWSATPFGTMAQSVPTKTEVTLQHQTLKYEKPIFEKLFPALQKGARTVSALAALPELESFGLEKVRAGLIRLLLGNHAIPFEAPTTTPAALPARLRIASEYNRAALNRASSKGYVLASPITGAGISLPANHAIALRVLTEVAPSNRRAWLADLCGRKAFKLEVKGRAIDNIDEQIAFFEVEIDKFEKSGALAKLFELGVLEASPNG